MGEAQERYVIVVQCDQVVHDACPGFMCEHAFTRRADAFSIYPADERVRYLPISCGGCPGRGTLRKLMNVKKNLRKREDTGSEIAAVHLSTCITRASHHGPRCPHIEYIKAEVARAGFVCREDSRISPLAEKRRDAAGNYLGK
ncbi:MAG: CGGC domain-containing protein [Planctomycetaceae bacterium]|nr:CGGC domain-containing protein [Planctomycetaceae bacterium]